MAKRTTRDEFQIHGNYSHGWEEVTAEDTRKEAMARLREYRANEPGTAFKLKVVRVKQGEGAVTKQERKRHVILAPGGKMFHVFTGAGGRMPIAWVTAYDKPSALKLARTIYADATLLIVPTVKARKAAVGKLPELTAEGLRVVRYLDVKASRIGLTGIPDPPDALTRLTNLRYDDPARYPNINPLLVRDERAPHPLGTPSLLRGGARGPEGAPEPALARDIAFHEDARRQRDAARYIARGWIITEDLIHDPAYDINSRHAVGVKTKDYVAGPDMVPFKLYDDDGVHYYSGKMAMQNYEGSESRIFGPLNWAMHNAGCTEIRIRNPKNGVWETI